MPSHPPAPTSSRAHATRRRCHAIAAGVAGALLLAVACSAVTDVEAPDVVQPPALDNSLGAIARHAGVVRDFSSASAGTVILVSGLLADELLSGALSTFTADLVVDARRVVDPGPFAFSYNALHQIRVNALQAIDALQRFAPDPRSRIGQLYAFAGFVELYFGEQYCSGVPLSTNRDGAVVYGAPLTTAAMLQQALAHFDSALVYAADSARIANMARVGRGRTLLSLARFADAASAVAAVPATYRYDLELSATVAGQSNGTFSSLNGRGNGVANREGGVGLDFRTAADPRVPTAANGRGVDGITDIFVFSRYNSLAAPVTLASGLEARLIAAEAALQANRNDASPTGTGWLGILNSLRSTAITPALPPLADPGSFDARVNLLFRERAFWLFLTGHRLGDLRRLVRQYGRAAESVFPTGTYKDGLPYGTSVNLTIPEAERNNPEYRGCLDRNA